MISATKGSQSLLITCLQPKPKCLATTSLLKVHTKTTLLRIFPCTTEHLTRCLTVCLFISRLFDGRFYALWESEVLSKS